MKKNIFSAFVSAGAALTLAWGLPATLRAQPREQFTLAADLLGQGAFSSVRGGPAFAGGLGAEVFGDWRPLPYLSLGTGLDFTQYFSGNWQASSWLLGGRIFPLPYDKAGEWYLQGGVGVDLAKQTLGSLPGNFRADAGLGYRLFLDPRDALDFGLAYDFYTPVSAPLQALGLKAGWTWMFGSNPAAPEPTATPAPAPAPQPVPAPAKTRKKTGKSHGRSHAHTTTTTTTTTVTTTTKSTSSTP